MRTRPQELESYLHSEQGQVQAGRMRAQPEINFARVQVKPDPKPSDVFLKCQTAIIYTLICRRPKSRNRTRHTAE
jgi:hypothetical protein